jgi:hypothetical protein
MLAGIKRFLVENWWKNSLSGGGKNPLYLILQGFGGRNAADDR